MPKLEASCATIPEREPSSNIDFATRVVSIHGESLSPDHTVRNRHVGTTSPSTSGQSPSLLSTLISQDILICTTIDLLAANEGRPSFIKFEQDVEHPFVTPYDPANWTTFKQHAVGIALRSTIVTTAILAAQECFQSRRLGLSHTGPIATYKMGWAMLDSAISSTDVDQDIDILFITTFLLSLVEVLVPGEIRPRLLDLSCGPLVERLREWSLDRDPRSSTSLRLTAWMLISHAAARRSGNSGLLCPHIRDLLEQACGHGFPLAPVQASFDVSSDVSILATLTEPLFAFYFQLQLLSTQVADLSHYHRSRTTGEDQEEVSSLMAELKSQIMLLWHSRPSLLHLEPEELYAQFTSRTIAEPLVLLAILCVLAYHTEIVELGRNLSAEQVPTNEAIEHLAQMRSILTSMKLPPCFLRALFLYSIESMGGDLKADSDWAVSRMLEIKDPVYYSDFFANFAKGLSDKQRQKERRVTTKWWCLEEFGINPPYL